MTHTPIKVILTVLIFFFTCVEEADGINCTDIMVMDNCFKHDCECRWCVNWPYLEYDNLTTTQQCIFKRDTKNCEDVVRGMYSCNNNRDFWIIVVILIMVLVVIPALSLICFMIHIRRRSRETYHESQRLLSS